MVEAIDTKLASVARGVSLSRTPVAKPQASTNRPDAPAQERANLDRVRESDAAADGKAAAQNESAGARTKGTATRPSITPLTNNSGLTTYRDQESGQVVVRIFDRESGDVLVEFPPENQRRPDDSADSPGDNRPNTALDV